MRVFSGFHTRNGEEIFTHRLEDRRTVCLILPNSFSMEEDEVQEKVTSC